MRRSPPVLKLNTLRPSSTPFLGLENIGKRFGGTIALEGIDWSVQAGEVHCLVGENGSGKSTLIKIIAGVLAPEKGGRIIVEGLVHDHLDPPLAKKLGIQVIYQDLSLFPNLSVLENIAIDHELGAPTGLIDKKAMLVSAETVLASLDAHLPLGVRVGQLSVAQRQIVAICRGLASNARLLFMDEPTSSLTRHEVELLLAVVRRLKKLGVAVVFVSHRLEEVVELAERITVLRDGRKVATLPVSEVNDQRLAELMTGSRFENSVPAHHLKDRPPALAARRATRSGEFIDVTFTLHAGEVLGLTGLLGAGRTELALALFGMSMLERGELLFDGAPLRLRSNRDAIAAGIAYVPEDRLRLGLNLRQSIADNVSIGVLDRLLDRTGLVPPGRRSGLAREWVSRLGIIAANVAAAVQTLSGGNQQRVVLAKWLATKPKVLILDSPTVGVDIRNKHGIYEVIRKLAKDGVAILLISDEMPEVFFNCDRVLHMREGQLAGEFIPGETSEEALTEAVFA
jgi:simple sugar transport system ATP-binding protein